MREKAGAAVLHTSEYQKSEATFLGDSRFSLLEDSMQQHALMPTPKPPDRMEEIRLSDEKTMYMEG